MAVDYLIIPGMYWYFRMPNITYLVSLATSVDAERAFSACTLILGKLCTCLLDESFQAGLLLQSWHNAGLPPELGELAQCLKDADAAAVAQRKESQKHPANEDCIGALPRKRAWKDEA